MHGRGPLQIPLLLEAALDLIDTTNRIVESAVDPLKLDATQTNLLFFQIKLDDDKLYNKVLNLYGSTSL